MTSPAPASKNEPREPHRLGPRDPEFEAKVRDSFDRQGIMRHLGARLDKVEPGLVEISLPFDRKLTA